MNSTTNVFSASGQTKSWNLEVTDIINQ